MNDKKSVRALRAANRIKKIQREIRIVEMRLEGYTCEQIGMMLAEEDGCDKSYSKQYISRCLQQYVRQVRNQSFEKIEEMILIELMRLDMLHQVAYKQAVEESNLAAIDRVLKIMERRAKLLGLDAVNRADIDIVEDSPRIVLYVPDNGRGPNTITVEK